MEFPFAGFDTVVTFDVETSGLDSRNDFIIEFGGVRVVRNGDGFAEDGRVDTLIRLPEGRRLNTMITNLTGITGEMLKSEGADPSDAALRIAALLDRPGTLISAYNAQFDLCFLYKLLHRCGLEKCLKHCKLLDALTVYRDRRPYPHKLSDAVQAYKLSGQNTHRAVDDALATWELLCRMGQEKDDLERYVGLFGYHPKYGVTGPKIGSVTYRAQPFDSALPLYERE